MGSYENFARVYDELMDNVPYEEWTDFILAILKKYKITDGLVLELGCGTGQLMWRYSVVCRSHIFWK